MPENFSSAFSEALQCGAEDMEADMEGGHSIYMSPEVRKAIEGVKYIAQHLKDEDDNANVSYCETLVITPKEVTQELQECFPKLLGNQSIMNLSKTWFLHLTYLQSASSFSDRRPMP